MSSSTIASMSQATRRSYGGVAIMPWLCLATLFLAVFGNGIDITRDVDRSQGISLSFQVLFRIGVGGSALLIGLWGWWRLPSVRQMLTSYRGWLVMLVIAAAFLSISQSPEPRVASFVAAMVLGYTLLTVTCLALFGFRAVVIAVMLAVWLFVLIGWGAYLFFPEIGVYQEYLSLTQSVDRMGGLGHPNTSGRSVCLATVMLLVACRQRWVAWPWALLAVPLLVVTLVATKSRSPVIATFLAFAVFSLPLLRQRWSYAFIAGGVLAAFAGALYLETTFGMDMLLQKTLLTTSKSGSLEEITTLTGRTQIWQESIAHIQRSPLLGYGGGSSARIMYEHSGHAHNMLLETALLYGIPVAFVIAALLCLNIKDSIYSKIPMIPEVTTFLVALGMVESPLVGMPADPLLALWLASLYARPLELLERQTLAQQAGAPPPRKPPSGLADRRLSPANQGRPAAGLGIG